MGRLWKMKWRGERFIRGPKCSHLAEFSNSFQIFLESLVQSHLNAVIITHFRIIPPVLNFELVSIHGYPTLSFGINNKSSHCNSTQTYIISYNFAVFT